MWVAITFWCVVGVSVVYCGAGILLVRALPKVHWIHFTWVPIASALLGCIIGLLSGGITSLVLAAVYVSVPYSIGADTAFGLGFGLALLITYFQLGRADFSQDSPPI
jgi:hypothetical protein